MHGVVHIVDDDAALRDSLRLLFRTRNVAARCYEGATTFLGELPGIRDGCVLIDVNMPDMSGIELLTTIRKSRSAMPCIVMTGYGEVTLAVKAMKAGAVDFIEKPFEDDILFDAVRHALEAVAESPATGQSDPRIARLTPRERDVMMGLARGEQNKVIANGLGISPRTVEIHRARVMTKLEAASVADVVRIAMGTGERG